jgi:putative thioredoxin
VIRDAGEADFAQVVVERSREVPVVVDFWAEWCRPCRVLGPTLERAAAEREGRVDLVKVDVDANPGLAQRFGVQGIPAVKAFVDGEVAAEFTGAVPPPQVERFMDGLVPSEVDRQADAALESGDEQELRSALEANPRNSTVAVALARILLARGDDEEALAVLEPHEADFVAAGLTARARLALDEDGPDLDAAFRAWDGGDAAAALEGLQEAFASADPDARDPIRKAMVAIFTELGADHPLAREHRRRLSAVLY